MKKIAEMSTAEMVAEYNVLTGKSIKKFSSRAAGEKQLAKAREFMTVAKAVVAEAVKKDERKGDRRATDRRVEPATVVVKETSVKKQFNYAVDGCPNCGATEDQTYAGAEGTTAEERNFCHHCSTEYWRETGKIYKAPAKSEKRSTAISESWNDPKIAAKRARRDNVEVKGVGIFRSVCEAFKKLHLPMNQHIKFRMSVKEAGTGTFKHGDKAYKFALVEKK